MTVGSRRDEGQAAGCVPGRGPVARPGQLRAYYGGAAAARRLWNGLIASLPVSAGAVVLDGGPADRRRLFGRFAAMFFCRRRGAGPGEAAAADVGVRRGGNGGGLRGGAGFRIAAWCAPWQRWPQRASLALVPPAFTLIAAVNVFGGRTRTLMAFSSWSRPRGSAWPIGRAHPRPWRRWGRRLRCAAVLAAPQRGCGAGLGGCHYSGLPGLRRRAVGR